MNNLIEERKRRTIRRKIAKREYDNIINLSASESGHRLLTEGAITTADGGIDCYLKRGTIEKFIGQENAYLPNIDKDYTGYINLGHLPFAEFPIGILGQWSLNDFSVVDVGNDRRGINVNLHLWEDSPIVQALRVMPFDVGLSAEFYFHVDDEASREKGIEVIDEICIKDFAIVGECGDVEASGLQLKGETMNEETKVENVVDSLEELEETEEIEVIDEAEETEEESVEESTDETEEEIEEEAEGTVEEEEEVEDETDDTDSLDEIMEAVENLTTRVEELESENKRLKAELKRHKKAASKFKDLAVGLNPELNKKKEKPKETSRYGGYSDGVGA